MLEVQYCNAPVSLGLITTILPPDSPRSRNLPLRFYKLEAASLSVLAPCRRPET